jgi:hypothetical protein
MTRKRRLVIATAAALFIVLLNAAWLILHLFHGADIRRETFDRIEMGMTWKEVEAVLGGPPGHYNSVPVIPDTWVGNWLHPEECDLWWGNEGVIEIAWKDWSNLRVFAKRFVGVQELKQCPAERLQWHVWYRWRQDNFN